MLGGRIRITADDRSSVCFPRMRCRVDRDNQNEMSDCVITLQGIRALTIDKDNSPKWNPATLDEVAEEKINLVFEPLEGAIELLIPETEENRWGGKYETSGFA